MCFKLSRKCWELKELRELKELKTYVQTEETLHVNEKTIVFNSFKLLELPKLET